MNDTQSPINGRMELGKLQAVGGQWDDDGNAVIHVTTEQKYVSIDVLEALQSIIDAGVNALTAQPQRAVNDADVNYLTIHLEQIREAANRLSGQATHTLGEIMSRCGDALTRARAYQSGQGAAETGVTFAVTEHHGTMLPSGRVLGNKTKSYTVKLPAAPSAIDAAKRIHHLGECSEMADEVQDTAKVIQQALDAARADQHAKTWAMTLDHIARRLTEWGGLKQMPAADSVLTEPCPPLEREAA